MKNQNKSTTLNIANVNGELRVQYQNVQSLDDVYCLHLAATASLLEMLGGKPSDLKRLLDSLYHDAIEQYCEKHNQGNQASKEQVQHNNTNILELPGKNLPS